MAKLPQDVISNIISPKIITISNFTDDVIKFEIDERFRPRSLIKQLEVVQGSTRDGTGKLTVDFGKDAKAINSVQMFSPLYNSIKISKFINTNFTEFVKEK